MIFLRCKLDLLASNLSQEVANSFLKVYTWFACIQLQKVANDFLKVYTWFAYFQLESEGCE